MDEAKFPLGQIVATQRIMGGLSTQDRVGALVRHAKGDWGDLCEEDKQMNEEALTLGNRILSKYTAENGKSFYIITEWDRSVTTILFPDEY